MTKPNIVIILADDMGWMDVGYHGSEIKTPVLDKLAGEGARLNQFYVMSACTPTRASMLTGRYTSRYGMQTGVNHEATAEFARHAGAGTIASGGVTDITDIERLIPLEKDGIVGVITGRAIYEGTLDLVEAIERTKNQVNG